jgi:hypothetical protein
MELLTFAKQNRLTVRKDDCGDAIIPGKYGHIYEDGSDRLGVCIMSNAGNAYRWNRARTAFTAAGMDITQNGDDEGCATFDHENATQAKTAMLHAKVRTRRQVSPERREALMASLARARRVRQSISLV